MRLSFSIQSWLFRAVLVLFTVISIIFIDSFWFQNSNAQSDSNLNNIPQERILNYESEIDINQDASLKVTETITVQATGNQIKQGIYRYLPLTSPFYPVKVPLKVVKVLRNGNATPYSVKEQGKQKRIDIYQKNTAIEPGIYDYTIQYETKQQLDFSDADTDRLYWKVTGYGWHFPIDQVQAKVLLPETIAKEDLQFKAFTGIRGERKENYQVEFDTEDNPTFVTTAQLDRFEGLTIIVEFPKGDLVRPSWFQSLYWQFLPIVRPIVIVALFFSPLLVLALLDNFTRLTGSSRQLRVAAGNGIATRRSSSSHFSNSNNNSCGGISNDGGGGGGI